jgi:hypothetical protein
MNEVAMGSDAVAQGQRQRPPTEEWRVIPGFDRYEVSSWGRVRRLTPYRSTTVGKILKTDRQRGGHLLVRLGMGGGKVTAMSVHRLVALAFVGPAPSAAHLVAHSDGTPAHNWANNVSWKTHRQNMADRIVHGTDPSGERNPNAKLSDDDVRLIRAWSRIGETKHAVLARLFNVSDSHIHSIVTGALRAQAGGYL